MRILTTGAAEDIARTAGGDCWFELLDVELGTEDRASDIIGRWREDHPEDAALLNCRLALHNVCTGYGTEAQRDTVTAHLLLTNADVPVIEDAPCVTPEMAEEDPAVTELDCWYMDYYPYDYTYTGRLHWPTPFTRDASAQSQGQDGAQTMQVRLGDPSGALWRFVESAGGLRGCTATLSLARLREYPVTDIEASGGPVELNGQTVVAARAFAAEASVEYTIRTCATDGARFTFGLSSDNPFSRQWPPRRMFKARCRWAFLSPECGYEGADADCGHTIADCRARGNIARIGCFPGCGTGGLAQ